MSIREDSVHAPFGRRVWKCTFLNRYICIGYLLPTFVEYMSLGGFLCAFRAHGRGMYNHLMVESSDDLMIEASDD